MSAPESANGEEGGRKRGRPRVAEPLSSVSARVPVAYHDRLVKLATLRDQTVSSLVRQLLLLRLK